MLLLLKLCIWYILSAFVSLAENSLSQRRAVSKEDSSPPVGAHATHLKRTAIKQKDGHRYNEQGNGQMGSERAHGFDQSPRAINFVRLALNCLWYVGAITYRREAVMILPGSTFPTIIEYLLSMPSAVGEGKSADQAKGLFSCRSTSKYLGAISSIVLLIVLDRFSKAIRGIVRLSLQQFTQV